MRGLRNGRPLSRNATGCRDQSKADPTAAAQRVPPCPLTYAARASALGGKPLATSRSQAASAAASAGSGRWPPASRSARSCGRRRARAVSPVRRRSPWATAGVGFDVDVEPARDPADPLLQEIPHQIRKGEVRRVLEGAPRCERLREWLSGVRVGIQDAVVDGHDPLGLRPCDEPPQHVEPDGPDRIVRAREKRRIVGHEDVRRRADALRPDARDRGLPIPAAEAEREEPGRHLEDARDDGRAAGRTARR